MFLKQFDFLDIPLDASCPLPLEKQVEYGLTATNEKPVFSVSEFPGKQKKSDNGKTKYKVYADGARHRIALPIKNKVSRRLEFDPYFSLLYSESMEQGLSQTAQFLHIRGGLISKYSEWYLSVVLGKHSFTLDAYIAYRIECKVWRQRGVIDFHFDALYLECFNKKLKGAARCEYIKSALIDRFGDNPLYDTYIAERIERKEKNLYERKKRFRRKAYINPWTHFVTFTCDDKKCSVYDFERKLKKCLSNLHTRRGWKYAVVKERGKKTDRIHFHGLFFIPEGQMIGVIRETREYNPESRRMETRNRNSFFYDTFGRNDFAPINGRSRSAYRPAMEYIWKYMGKTDERLFYSFSLPTEIETELSSDDIAMRIFDFCVKFILWDDVFEDEDIPVYDTMTELNC
ncbi:MAG: hypothetical protein LBP62_02940 [Clostridiales bacterium]|nr:hypothetical protein [Clostridiales bacterium]